MSSEDVDADVRGSSYRLSGVQTLRALAALVVVAAHSLGDIKSTIGVTPIGFYYLGALGVDLFFVISGFVMVYSTRRLVGSPHAAGLFMRRRLIRIVPLYWATTCIYMLMQLGQGKWALLAADRLATTAVFWPYPDPQGLLNPVYSIGWTLNFEMFFYASFALGLGLSRRRPVLLTGAGLCGLVIAGSAVALPAPLSFWSHSMVLEFVLGMALAVLHGSHVTLSRSSGAVMSSLAFACLAAGGLAGYNATLPQVPVSFPRWMAWGCPCAIILASTVLTRAPALRFERGLVALGDASYAMYLLHPLVIIGMRPLLRSLYGQGLYPNTVAMAHFGTVCAIVIGLAVLTHARFERPLDRALQDYVDGWRSRARPTPQERHREPAR